MQDNKGSAGITGKATKATVGVIDGGGQWWSELLVYIYQALSRPPILNWVGDATPSFGLRLFPAQVEVGYLV